MLKRVGEELHDNKIIKLKDSHFPAPYHAGLEYSSPARGTWNIVHTGMLIPESHLIFVCAYGCLRGVVLTAAEMNCLDRYSSISIREENVLYGGMEELMINGVADIIEKLPKRPRAILLFISCHHFFLAYDQQIVFDTLKERFPDIRFTDNYMIPTLRKSGITPDQKMRMQVYRFWDPIEEKLAKKINFIGSNHRIDPDCELVTWLEREGFDLWDLQRCQNFDEYRNMANASLNIYYEPLAKMGAEDIEERCGIPSMYLTFSFQSQELEAGYKRLAKRLGIAAPDFGKEKAEMEAALKEARDLIGDRQIALDYTFTFRILSLAKLLLDHDFHVTRIYADAFAEDDRQVYEELKETYPDIEIAPTNQPEMRFCHDISRDPVLALGQKAAYFEGTDHFVEVVESGGYFGYKGMTRICELMKDAYLHEKDRKTIIQRKGFRCESCI